MSTVLDLIKAAHREIGVLSAGETLVTADADDARTLGNRMLNGWKADNLTMYSETRYTGTLTANQASFTVGTGGNINIVRPIFINRVTFQDTAPTPDIEYDLGPLLTDQEWESIPMKAITSPFPQRAYWNPTYPLGTLTPWPVATASTLQWVIYAMTAVAEFAALTDTVTLPPSYEDAYVQNLALRLCPSYGVQPHPVLVESARASLATAKRANIKITQLTFPADTLGDRLWYGGPGSWNIQTGP